MQQVLNWSDSIGRIDVLINNAGITQKRAVVHITEQDYALVSEAIL